MMDSLERLGLVVDRSALEKQLVVTGCGGQLAVERANLYVANSGTTIRFLTAMLAACRGRFRLDGVPRMRERPIQDLLDALGQLGAAAVSESHSGCPPVVLDADGLEGGRARIRGDISSQFLSGLLLAAPYAKQNVTLEVEGELVSQPYVRMTLGVMDAFGVHVDSGSLLRFEIPRARYCGCDYQVEPDASAASYFWAAAAISGGTVHVEGITPDALQGDVAFCDCLRRMGCRVEHDGSGISVHGEPLRGIDVNMNAISDTVQTLAAVALFADGPTSITGVAHIRHKETDRIADLARELRKLGAVVDEHSDGLRITPGPLRAAGIDTYHDHRMAMSLALVGLRVPGIVIHDPACAGKTYPRFFEDLAALGTQNG
jgi:3-phosphoshikimate 1-carboxyvinyltransferase